MKKKEGRPPKISIVTPSFNQGKFLEDTIISVLNQKYANLEYIIIDGGSTDNSVDIIRKYERKLEYWETKEDSGQAEAINKGLKRCSGDIIAWINSDDVYVSGAFELIARYFNDYNDIDMVYGDAEIIDKNGKLIMHRKEIPFDKKMGLIIGFGVLIPQPTAFWRRHIFESVGFLNERLHYSMDSDFWIRIAENHTILHVPKLLARSRYHESTKTIERFSGKASRAVQEEKIEFESCWQKLTISGFIPFRYSNLIRHTYHIKRIIQRGIRGHYFSNYKTHWYFKKTY